MTVEIRTLRVDEIADATAAMDGVMRRAYNAPTFVAQIGWYSTVQPDCLVVATDGDTIVGTGCGIAYPDAGFGWIGVIATEPAYERQGIGKRITEHIAAILDGLGCASVLDASLAGEPLYTRMGFVDHGPTRVMAIDPAVAVGSSVAGGSGVAGGAVGAGSGAVGGTVDRAGSAAAGGAVGAAGGAVDVAGGAVDGAGSGAAGGAVDGALVTVMSSTVFPATELSATSAGDVADVAAYDASVFGADRSELLRLLVHDHPGRSAFVRSASGAVAGFVIAQHAVIGPFAADDSDALRALLAFAAGLPWDNGARICVPPESVHLPTLVELGCHTVRELRHMRRGIDVLPGRSDRYAGRISLGIG